MRFGGSDEYSAGSLGKELQASKVSVAKGNKTPLLALGVIVGCTTIAVSSSDLHREFIDGFNETDPLRANKGGG